MYDMEQLVKKPAEERISKKCIDGHNDHVHAPILVVVLAAVNISVIITCVGIHKIVHKKISSV